MEQPTWFHRSIECAGSYADLLHGREAGAPVRTNLFGVALEGQDVVVDVTELLEKNPAKVYTTPFLARCFAASHQ